jgi:hypothetical protein
VKRALPALLLVLALVGCPEEKPKGNVDPPVAPVETTTAPVVTGMSWTAVADLVAARLDEMVKAVEAGDKKAALDAHEKAYFVEYEGEAHNLEVATRQLEPELFEGKLTVRVIVRETAFSDLKGAIRSGAPSEKVRELADALLAKIRDDARQLDSH